MSTKIEICKELQRLIEEVADLQYDDSIYNNSSIRLAFEDAIEELDKLLEEIKDYADQDFRKEVVDKVLAELKKNNISFAEATTYGSYGIYYSREFVIYVETEADLYKALPLARDIAYSYDDVEIDYSYNDYDDGSGWLSIQFEK